MKTMKAYRLIGAGLAALLAVACGKEGGDTPGVPDDGMPRYQTVTVAEFLSLETGSTYYHLKGKVASVSDSHYSQFILDDGTASVTVYGLWSSQGGGRIYDMGGYKVGDAVSIAAQRADYLGAIEARKAYPYDPSAVVLWVSPLEFIFPSAGGSEPLEVLAAGTPSFETAESWLRVEGPDASGAYALKVDENTDLDDRMANVYVVYGDVRQRVRVYQDAFVPVVSTVAEAVSLPFARVQGTVTALDAEGYVLADATGAVFVRAAAPEVGTVMDVIGNLSTEDFLTSIVPVRTSRNGSAEVVLPGAEKLTAASARSLEASLAGKDGSVPGLLNLRYVVVEGIVAEADGRYVLRDFNTDEDIVTVRGDLSGRLGAFLAVSGYLFRYAGGVLELLPASIAAAVVDSAVTIDGKFDDWASIEGYSQDSSNPVYGFKVYTAGTDIYLYAKMRRDFFTEWGVYKYFLQVYFDTDLDQTTGPYAWVFRGLDASSYIRVTNGSEGGFNTSGQGSIFFSFLGGDGLPFISANASLFAGYFFASNGSYPCGGAISGDAVEFEWRLDMGTLTLPRHARIGIGLRLCHEGPDTPSGDQENYFLPATGWAYYDSP